MGTLIWLFVAIVLIIYPVHCHYRLYSMSELISMEVMGIEIDPYTQGCYDYYLNVVMQIPYLFGAGLIILTTLLINYLIR
jgi:hypothetical protein